jgi:hypothetical protein
MEWIREMPVNKTERACGLVHVFEDDDDYGSSFENFAVDTIGAALFEADPQKFRSAATGGGKIYYPNDDIKTLKSLWDQFKVTS